MAGKGLVSVILFPENIITSSSSSSDVWKNQSFITFFWYIFSITFSSGESLLE